MKKIIPSDANLIPQSAKRVFKGEIYEVWQWPQKMYDGSMATFEMLKRPDTVVVIAVKDDKIVALNQSQPNLKEPFLDFPGGRADEGETPLESAQRELLEETGMTFKRWKLLDVVQPHQKIEWFVYTYLTSEFDKQVGANHDVGEKIEQLLMAYDEIIKYSGGRMRLDSGLLKMYGSLDKLMEAPEFKGKEVDR